MTFSFDALRRSPDVEAPNLFAADAADRLILDTAAAALRASAEGDVVVIGDRYGALTLGAAALHGARAVRVHQDPLTGERALAQNAERAGFSDVYRSMPLESQLLAGARVVLLQLPRSLDALAEIAELISRSADPGVIVFAGGMIKHLSVTMNGVLADWFGELNVGLARQKARVLTASAPTHPASASRSFPRREFHSDLNLTVCAYGAAFAGTKIDIGTRFLVGFLDRANPDAETAIDLGCGTGVIAASLARSRPGLAVIATDQSAGAVASAAATMVENGLADRVTVLRDDGAAAQPSASVDLVVLNPPFHVGSTVHTGAALKLFADAARVLKPGGELMAVWNSHLAYSPALTRLVGPTTQLGRNSKFTVTTSTVARRPA